MSDSPARRQWLDKLLQFMEENKTPIAACPTISKNPLDLYALYLHVKERGGFMEVCATMNIFLFVVETRIPPRLFVLQTGIPPSLV
jgi:hypothetical protein